MYDRGMKGLRYLSISHRFGVVMAWHWAVVIWRPVKLIWNKLF